MKKISNSFTEHYAKKIQGILSCYDRVLIKGTLHSVGHAGAMTNLLYRKDIALKDYSKFVNPYRNQLHALASQIAQSHNIEIEFIRKPRLVRKEDLVQKHLSKLQEESDYRQYTGLVCILSAMESCQSYQYRYDKSTGRSYLQMTSGKCLHYYYYFIDRDLGLCHLRVPTWCPFRLQFYFNGHNWLAKQLDKENIDYELIDNAFVNIGTDDMNTEQRATLYEQVQKIANSFDCSQLHQTLNYYARKYCSVYQQICSIGYHWSIMQAEYATDIIFNSDKTVGKIYDNLLNRLVLSVQPDDIAQFLGRKHVHGKNNLEIDTSCKQMSIEIKGKRHLMRRIKHRMGSASIKMYDKFSRVLRIETTLNDTTQFRHYRSVEQRDGSKISKVAPVKKYIYSLKPLADILWQCNKRYLNFIAAFDNNDIGQKRLKKVTSHTKVNDRKYKGFNFFDKNDEIIFKAIAAGEFIINGMRNKSLKQKIINISKNKMILSTAQVSRILKRLLVKGVVRKRKGSYEYYLTNLGSQVIATALNVKELIANQQFAY